MPLAIFRPLKGATTMRPRHQNGQVEVRSDSKGKYYCGRYTVYVKDEMGKHVRKQPRPFLGYCAQISKSEAWERLNRLIYSESPQEVRTTDKVDLRWFFTSRFLPLREARWERVTRDGHLCDWRNYIQPELGKKLLAELDKFILQTHVNNMAKRNLSLWTVKRVKTLLSMIFIEAVDLGFMASNPMAKVKLPKCKPAHKPVLQAEDMRRLEQALLSRRDRLIFRMACIWGTRTSEIFGLTVDSFKGNHFEIQNTAYKGQLRRLKMKTSASFRQVPVSPWLSAEIELRIAEHHLKGNSLLFPGKDGTRPLWGNTWLQKRVQPVAKALGITTPITFQVIRRSFSTRHRDQLKDAAAVCGHSEDTARKLYAQSVSSAVRDMVELDEQMIFGETPAEGKVQ